MPCALSRLAWTLVTIVALMFPGRAAFAQAPAAMPPRLTVFKDLQTFMQPPAPGSNPTTPVCVTVNGLATCSAQCVQPPTNCRQLPSPLLLTVAPGTPPPGSRRVTSTMLTALPPPHGEIDANQYVKVFTPVGLPNRFVFQFDLYVTPAASQAQALEFDLFDYVGNDWFNFSSRCVYSPNLSKNRAWQIWDPANPQASRWVDSNLPCVPFAANRWHHVRWDLKILPSPTSPRVCYLNLTVDGRKMPVGVTEPVATRAQPYKTAVAANIALTANTQYSAWINRLDIVARQQNWQAGSCDPALP